MDEYYSAADTDSDAHAKSERVANIDIFTRNIDISIRLAVVDVRISAAEQFAVKYD